jgi:putative restriction endonuclease
MAPLSKNELLDLLETSISSSGWRSLIISTQKPFKFHVYNGEEKGLILNVYIWNCTHGGGAKRSADEFRVQITGNIPKSTPGEKTLILGWHSGYDVFAGFDIEMHIGQASSSPSIQIKEETLQAAHSKAFAIYHRHNGEIAVAFRPEFLVDYAINSTSLHTSGFIGNDERLLNDLSKVDDAAIALISSYDRKHIISTITKKYRATDFRRRVLAAYEHRCAVCGVQLQLIDAAHIIPVVAATSTDETKNGVALCKIHHFAFDKNLISFDTSFKIEVSSHEVKRLAEANHIGGLPDFKKNLRTAIILPSDKRDYPPSSYITESRRVRRWMA